jgi:hypothetical protein
MIWAELLCKALQVPDERSGPPSQPLKALLAERTTPDVRFFAAGHYAQDDDLY